MGKMKELTVPEFERIRTYIKTNFGISLSNEKKTLVHSRLRTTLDELGFDNFTQYFDYLIKDKTGEAVVRFVDKITTNHTFFMRETEHFDYLRETVLPYIAEEYKSQRDLRLWCAACSSGEEAVTLQMIAQDFFKKIPFPWDTNMLASDISTKVLDKAVEGKYPTESLANLPAKWTTEYFTKINAQLSQVKPNILNAISYRKLNLMESFKFKQPFQIIFCRNVMIYFDNQTRDAVVRKFYDVMEPGGYLFIGHSESISNSNTGYQYIKPAVYRKPK